MIAVLSSLLSNVQAVVGSVRLADSAPTANARPVRLTSAYGRAAMDAILRAADLDDALDLVDAASGDQEFWDAESANRPPVPRDVLIKRLKSVQIDQASLAPVIGQHPTERCVAGMDALKDIFLRLFELPRDDTPSAEPMQPLKIGELVYLTDLPLGLRHGIAEFLRSAVSASAIARAEEKGDRLEPWLAKALAESFAGGLENIRPKLLAALSSPDAIRLSTAERRHELETEHAQLTNWANEADKVTDEVYFPSGDGHSLEP